MSKQRNYQPQTKNGEEYYRGSFSWSKGEQNVPPSGASSGCQDCATRDCLPCLPLYSSMGIPKTPLRGWLASPLLADGSCLMLGLSPVTTELKETAPDAGMGFEGHCSAQTRGTDHVFHPAMADTNVSTLFTSLKFSVPVHIPFVNLRSRRSPKSRINPAV